MKTHLTVLMLLLANLQAMAQCRLVRVESSDTSYTGYYTYDKWGKLISYKNVQTYENKTTKSEFQYAYESDGKVTSLQQRNNDTLLRLRHFIYEKGIMTKFYSIVLEDTLKLYVVQLFYNDKQQLIHLFSKASKNDTMSIDFEYAPEGWLKRRKQQWNTGGNIFEYSWNSDEKISDDPERILFAGYPIQLLSTFVAPIEPLTIKGNAKGWTHYTIDKDGKETKNNQGEVFDICANAEGLWLSSKYKNYDFTKNKETITTYRAFYEGCKN